MRKDSVGVPGNQEDKEQSVLAVKVRALRQQLRLTLQQVSDQSGISVSTLSKIENGQLSPTYERIVALAQGLNVDVSELFNTESKPTPLGRLSVSIKGKGIWHETEQYHYEVLHVNLADKRFVPLVATIKAHSFSDFPALHRHEGEEFMYVLSGRVVVSTDFYAPLELSVGDSCYFDSTMGHACISAGDTDANVLWVSSNPRLE